MSTMTGLPVLAADLTYVRVNGGRAHADIVNWNEDADPVVGQHVLLAGGSSERLEAEIIEIRADGTVTLAVLAYASPLRSAT